MRTSKRQRAPFTGHILTHAIGAGVIAAIFVGMGWHIAGLVSSILAFGLATTWVNTAFVRSSQANGSPPAWLSRLERIRQYLANEGDDEPTGNMPSGGTTKVVAPR